MRFPEPDARELHDGRPFDIELAGQMLELSCEARQLRRFCACGFELSSGTPDDGKAEHAAGAEGGRHSQGDVNARLLRQDREDEGR